MQSNEKFLFAMPSTDPEKLFEKIKAKSRVEAVAATAVRQATPLCCGNKNADDLTKELMFARLLTGTLRYCMSLSVSRAKQRCSSGGRWSGGLGLFAAVDAVAPEGATSRRSGLSSSLVFCIDPHEMLRLCSRYRCIYVVGVCAPTS